MFILLFTFKTIKSENSVDHFCSTGQKNHSIGHNGQSTYTACTSNEINSRPDAALLLYKTEQFVL